MCATSAATGALSAAEVRGRSREDPMPKGQWPRGVTPSLRSGAAARVPDCDGAGTAERSYPASEVGGAAKRSYPASEVRGSSWEELPHAPKPEARGGRWEELPHAPMPEARGGGREDQPHVQGAVAARVQEGLEELSHTEGQEGRW